jgi:hypothetical protein
MGDEKCVKNFGKPEMKRSLGERSVDGRIIFE